MHLRRHKPPQPEHVPDCQKPKAKRKLHAQVHGLQVRKPRKRALKCPVCGQVFCLIKEVNGHVKQAHLKFQYKCKYCLKNFKTMLVNTSMNTNMDYHHIHVTNATKDFSLRKT